MVGFGDSVPCWPGHPSDESSGAHPARHGGHVTGLDALSLFNFCDFVYSGLNTCARFKILRICHVHGYSVYSLQ